MKEKVLEKIVERERELELSDYLHQWERFEPIHSVDEKAEGLYKVRGKSLFTLKDLEN